MLIVKVFNNNIVGRCFFVILTLTMSKRKLPEPAPPAPAAGAAPPPKLLPEAPAAAFPLTKNLHTNKKKLLNSYLIMEVSRHLPFISVV